jgi:hypothetical protein
LVKIGWGRAGDGGLGSASLVKSSSLPLSGSVAEVLQ